MKLTQPIIKQATICLLAIALTHCGGTQFAGSGTNNGDASGNPLGPNDPNNPNGNGPGGNAPLTPADIIAACNNSNAVHLTLQRTLSFPPRENCTFNANGNGSPVDVFHMARESQTLSLDLPANAIICNVGRFQSSASTSSIRYDDWLFVTMNDYVLVGTDVNMVNLLEQDGSLRRWDWSRIYGTAWSSNPSIYCLGSTCVFPGTDQTGPINLSFGIQEMAQLSAKILEDQAANMTVIVTGDNDIGDCEHSGIDLEIELNYILE